MLAPVVPIFLLATSALAAPSSDTLSQLSFDFAASTPGGFTALAHKVTNSFLSSIGLATLSSYQVDEFSSQAQDESKTIWKVINENENLSQLAHVLNYSSDATKKLLDDESQKLTLFAPINWYHKKATASGDRLHAESSMGAGHEVSAISELSQIQAEIQILEASIEEDDKERRRRMIAHIIDAVLAYHIVDSNSLLSYDEIARNSSVASKLNLGQYQKKVELGSLSDAHDEDIPNLNDGEAWRIRVGKSLLPRPAVYLNFYSRVVSPDHQLKNGILHAVSAPLLPPPSVLQSLFFGIPDYASVSAALLKTGGSHYLGFPQGQHDHSEESDVAFNGHHHPGSTALTFFAPGNSAFYKLPVRLRLFLFSPFGEKFLAKILMLHSLPFDIVYADAVHHVRAHKASLQSAQVETFQSNEIAEAFGAANITKYTFNSALPKLNCSESHSASAKLEFEQVDVEVARYYLLPGGRGPLQTRMKVQNVPVLLQDIPAANGVWHTLTSFIMPKGHPKDSIWGAIAQEAEMKGFGKVDLDEIKWN